MIRLFTLPALAMLVLFVLPLYGWNGIAETTGEKTDKTHEEEQKLKIIPLIQIKPGETRQLLLSTWCPVGPTRGGGFFVTEMRDGKPVDYDRVKTYQRAGVTVTVPGFDEAQKFAQQEHFGPLQKSSVDPFKVTITAAQDAPVGLMEIHLVDTTCAGQCQSDFRVLVVGP